MSEISEPSPAAIAASVRRGAKMQVTEAELATLRQKRDEIRDQTIALISARDAGNNREIVALEKERLALEAKIRDARQALAPPREAHAAAVIAALSGARREAATRFLSALAEMRAAAATLDEAAREINHARGEAPFFSLPHELGALEAEARRLAGFSCD